MADHVEEKFEWDINKSNEVYARHGFDFRLVAKMLAARTVYDRLDERKYGEERVIAVGRARGFFITAVYTIRASRKRIITAWRSKRTEIDDYVKVLGYRSER